MSNILPVVYFDKAVSIPVKETDHIFRYPAKCVCTPPMPTTKEMLKDWMKQPYIQISAADEVFTTYSHPDHKAKKILFTHLGGGLGDIVAFSAVAEYLRSKTIIVHVESHLLPVFHWYSNQDLRLKDWYDPIVTEFTPSNRLTRYATYARLKMEYAAIDAREGNWYDAMFQRMGLTSAPADFRRPRLIRRTDSKSKYVKRNSVLIAHRSSCQIRSSSFEDFYYPVKNAYPGMTIYVHQIDLTPDDYVFTLEKARDVVIIPKCSISDYFDNLYAASMVVCTDTSAIHFREGVQKPCVAAFGAMTAYSRTDGYRFTKGFDVESICPHQPCFIHELIKGQHCHLWDNGPETAPCQSGEKFQEQLYRELKQFSI